MTSRRELLGGLLLAPLLPWASAGRAEAVDYGSAAEVFDAIDRLEADVAARLSAVGERLATARPFVDSALADHTRHRAGR